MIQSIRQFSGKRLDTVAHMIQYIMAYMDGEKVYAPECLTFRPFFRKYAEEEKTRFIKPYVSATTGFEYLFTLCGKPGEYIRTFPDADSLFENYKRHDFEKNPVIIGPFSKKKIWNRIDSLFYDNKSYFVFVLDKKQDKYFFHDPEGTPYCIADEELFRNALGQAGEDIISIEMRRIACRERITWEQAENFLSDLKRFCAQVQQDTMAGAGAWKPLRLLLEEEFSSSAQRCLYYNMMEIQQAYQSIREYFCLNSFGWGNKEKYNLLEKYIQQLEYCCAGIMEALLRKNINSIKPYIEEIMDLEHELLELYLRL